MFILTIAIIVLMAAVRALLSALFVLFTCFIDVYFMYIFSWTNKWWWWWWLTARLYEQKSSSVKHYVLTEGLNKQNSGVSDSRIPELDYFPVT